MRMENAGGNQVQVTWYTQKEMVEFFEWITPKSPYVNCI